jgi:metallo-beta-lactamase family protein
MQANPPKVTFWGAAQTVTGSMHLVSANGKKILLDCGLFQGPRLESINRNRDFPFKAKEIDAVILSHAHIDHSGNLPNLVRHGFSGPIFCTPATRALANVMLEDSAKIQAEDAAYLNKKRPKGEPAIEPIYDIQDVYRVLTLLKGVRYGEKFAPLRGVECVFADAGHLLGSATLQMKIDGPNGIRTLCFTGDIGRNGLPILNDPEPLPECDTIITECTYGGHVHEPVVETADHLGEVINKTVKRGGKVIIPAFALGRTQAIVYFLHQLMVSKKLVNVPIYVDSPMAVKATEVFRQHPECFDPETLAVLSADRDLFAENKIDYVEKVNDSIALNSLNKPCVIVSASGMCEAGRILHHLKHNVGDPRNTILIAGYQAEHTLGRRLIEKRPEVKILGRPCPVRAEVVSLNGLSSHADQNDLIRMFTPLAGKTKRVRLVHGDPARAQKFADSLKPLGFTDVAIPARGDSVEI